MKYVLTTLAVSLISLNAFADTSELCPGEDGYYYTNYRVTQNPLLGGFVSYTATIADTTRIVIGRKAAVCGYAIIEGSAQVNGNAIVRGTAQVLDASIITENVIIEGNAVISGKSIISGNGTISSGAYQDHRERLASAAPPTHVAPTLSATDLSIKLQRYVREHASYLSPSDGSNYHSGITLSQDIKFSNGPCTVTITKNRKDDSSFGGKSVTSFNMRDVYAVYTRFYSPSVSSSSMQMKDKTSKASRQYEQSDGYKPNDSDWTNQYMLYNDNSVESIESSSKGDSEVITGLLTQLMKACQ